MILLLNSWRIPKSYASANQPREREIERETAEPRKKGGGGAAGPVVRLSGFWPESETGPSNSVYKPEQFTIIFIPSSI